MKAIRDCKVGSVVDETVCGTVVVEINEATDSVVVGCPIVGCGVGSCMCVAEG